MSWLKHKTKLNTWEYEPYAFEAGKIYVMEVDRASFSPEDVDNLNKYFAFHDITIHLITNRRDKRGLAPVELKRMTEKSRA